MTHDEMNNPISHKQKLVDLLQNSKDASILDYGCGKGDFINLLLSNPEPPKLIIAADADPAMMQSISNIFTDPIKRGLVIPKTVSSPSELSGYKFDKVICHNVLECVDDRLAFINSFKSLLNDKATFVLSHHDFDTAIYNSSFKELTRDLVHHFSDTQQEWQTFSDGQMGRKIPGLINHSVFKDCASCTTWRLVDNDFSPGTYGFLMADMMMDVGKGTFNDGEMMAWQQDLVEKSQSGEYYFAIDLVVASCVIS